MGARRRRSCVLQTILTEQKSNNPSDYIPSVYPKCECLHDSSDSGAGSLACFERAQRRCKMFLKQQKTREKEQESRQLYLKQALNAFEHDHGSLLKGTSMDCLSAEVES